MEFNQEEQIAKMKPHLHKLLSYLDKKGIEFSPTDGELPNVIFKSKDKEVKMSHHCFYRFSGLAYIYKEKGENEIEAVEVTDDMFYNSYMKAIVDHHFSDGKVSKK